MRIATIIVGYKNDDLSIAYIKEQLLKSYTNNVVVIVNNSSTAESCANLENQLGAITINQDLTNIKILGNVYVIDSKENLGFARANNLGVEFLKKAYPDIEFVLFSNNDIKILDSSVIGVLIEKLKNNLQIGLIGPNIVGVDGKRQNPQSKPSIYKAIFSPWLHYLKPLERYCDTAMEGYHYTFAECFFMCRISDYIACGMMDPYTFLYAEGCILSERMLSIGKQYYFVPQVTVVHENGTTTSKKYTLPKIRMMMAFANSYYYRTYCNTPKFAIWMYLSSERLRCLFSWLKHKFI